MDWRWFKGSTFTVMVLSENCFGTLGKRKFGREQLWAVPIIYAGEALESYRAPFGVSYWAAQAMFHRVKHSAS